MEYIMDRLWIVTLWIVTQFHNCDVRKDSDQSNHTIVNLF
jgi:hypothetical protein